MFDGCIILAQNTVERVGYRFYIVKNDGYYRYFWRIHNSISARTSFLWVTADCRMSLCELCRSCGLAWPKETNANGTYIKPFSLASGCVLNSFASEFRPGASAHRFTKRNHKVSRIGQTPFGYSIGLRYIQIRSLQMQIMLCRAGKTPRSLYFDGWKGREGQKVFSWQETKKSSVGSWQLAVDKKFSVGR